MIEREITRPVPLTAADGSLNPDALGWTRTPLHDTSGIGGALRGRPGARVGAHRGDGALSRAGRRRWGRDKRWEYWAVMSPEFVLACTISDIDYLTLPSVWLLDRATGEEISVDTLGPGGRAVLPASAGTGPARARARGLALAIDEGGAPSRDARTRKGAPSSVGPDDRVSALRGPAPGTPRSAGTRLRGWTPRVSFDLTADLPEGHERLGVVVPWPGAADAQGRIRRFQYTLKDVARPAHGWIAVDGVRHAVGAAGGRPAWAVLDHGRGRWPYRVAWNWAAGSGLTDGRAVGLQLGSKWTDGSGATENALVVDGHLTKISEELAWDYDPAHWMRPWRITGESADLTLAPFHHRHSSTQAVAVAQRADQVFGTWTGWVRDDTGARVRVDGIEGWAEDVLNRW